MRMHWKLRRTISNTLRRQKIKKPPTPHSPKAKELSLLGACCTTSLA